MQSAGQHKGQIAAVPPTPCAPYEWHACSKKLFQIVMFINANSPA